tara:strand:+ start:2260 stop:3081 length:822 start_codon:yes stop_codon:yes gene_type:complete
MDLDGARVLVTGGSRGIGAALARAYAAAGADVVVVARSESDLRTVADEVGGHAVVVDLSDPAAVEALVPRVEADLGPIDVLVNNAGVETVDMAAVIDPADVRTATRVNLEAPMVLTRYALPGMLDRGRGHIVYLSSIAGSSGFPSMATYCATKAGINGFVAALRMELKGSPVRTTLVAPGPVDTRMWDAVENSSSASTQSVIDRLNLLRLMPKADPDRLARRVVRATSRRTRHVRTPRRLSANFMLGEASQRLTEVLLVGVHLDPSDTRVDGS